MRCCAMGEQWVLCGGVRVLCGLGCDECCGGRGAENWRGWRALRSAGRTGGSGSRGVWKRPL